MSQETESDGMVIVDVRKATDEEMERMYWGNVPDHMRPVVLELSSGDVLLPSKDHELNGPGHFVGLDGDQVFDFDVSGDGS